MVKFIFIKDPVPCLTNRFSMYFFSLLEILAKITTKLKC